MILLIIESVISVLPLIILKTMSSSRKSYVPSSTDSCNTSAPLLNCIINSSFTLQYSLKFEVLMKICRIKQAIIYFDAFNTTLRYAEIIKLPFTGFLTSLFSTISLYDEIIALQIERDSLITSNASSAFLVTVSLVFSAERTNGSNMEVT